MTMPIRIPLSVEQRAQARLAAARGNPEPRFRAHALARLAQGAGNPGDAWTFFQESLRVALACHEPYRRVAASAWPIRAAWQRGIDLPGWLVPQLLAEASRIQQPSSRVYALELLWKANCPDIQNAFIETCLTAPTWRAGRALVRLCQTLEPEQARALLERIPPGRVRRKAERLT